MILFLAFFATIFGVAQTAFCSLEDVTTLSIVPSEIRLNGQTENHQILALIEASNSHKDATGRATITSENQNVAVVRDGRVYPKSNGTTIVTASVDGMTARSTVTVTNFEYRRPIGFHSDVLAALTKAGCNMGACHGSPSGKGGFRLSLRGYDPKLDLETLRGEFFNRRSNILNPDESLLLQKPLMQVAHGGGQRIKKADAVHTVLHSWISEGMQIESAGTATLQSIQILPSDRVLMDESSKQQLLVLASFSDGNVRDITELTAFDSSDESIATVSNDGLVHREGRGEATILARYVDRMATSKITFLTDRKKYNWKIPQTPSEIDRLVFRKLHQLQIQPSQPCSDTDFLRRATLDLTGRLPTLAESRDFAANTSQNRRSALVDKLLADDDHAKFWSMKWADLLRCNSKRMTSNGAHKFRRWLFEVVRSDLPLDQFAEQLLTASGSTNSNPATNYWRASRDSLDATETTAQLFLGIRIQCAKCHNHPFEKWTQDDYYGMAAAFHRVGRKASAGKDNETIFVKQQGEVKQPRTGETMKVRLLLRGSVDVPNKNDRRQVFANWLTAESNPFFAKSLANRIWGHLTGRGIVEPVDDFRDSNPPSNPDLLDFLASELVNSGYSMRHLIRTIMNSQTYQLAAKRNKFNSDDELYFSHGMTRMLTAEQLLDAICQVTGVAETFPGMPIGSRAIDLADPPKTHDFLQAFGQPKRELTCECERSTDSNLGQALQLINGPIVHNKIRSPQGILHQWIAAGKSDIQIIESLYLAAFSRKPAEGEVQISLQHIATNSDRILALQDIFWAVINSKEFLFQH